MTDQNSTQNPETAAPEEVVVVEPNRLQSFVLKHPRIAKVAAITGAVTAVVGTALTVNNVRKNQHHLDAAAGDAKDALYELGQSVSPDPENAA